MGEAALDRGRGFWWFLPQRGGTAIATNLRVPSVAGTWLTDEVGRFAPSTPTFP
jgi:hypothetical protein